MTENELSKIIVDSAFKLHTTFGPGLLESVYEEALVCELEHRGVSLQRQLPVPIMYKGHTLSTPLRLDLLIEKKVIVECKALALYNTVFESQLLTYLRLTGLRLGLVINFGETLVNKGIHRVVNRL